MEKPYDDNDLMPRTFSNRIITRQIPVSRVRVVNPRLDLKYLSRVYTIFIFQLLLSGAYVLYPLVWWSSIQVSLIVSPFVVNVCDYTGLRRFYTYKLAGLVVAEFLALEYFIFIHSVGIIITGLIVTFVLCSLLYAYAYATGKLIVLGLPPANTVLLLLIVTIMSYFKNQSVFDGCLSLKNMLAIFYVMHHSYVIQPITELEYIRAGTKFHVSFLLTLVSVFTLLNLYVF